jgi:hypothetical protein
VSDTTDFEPDFDVQGVEAIFEEFNDQHASEPPVLDEGDAPELAGATVSGGDEAGSGEDADTGTAAHVGSSEGIDLGDEVGAPEPDPTVPSGDGPATDWFAPLEQRLGRTLNDAERANAASVMADILSADQARQQAIWQATYGVPAEAPAPTVEAAPNPLDELDDLVDPEAAAILRQAMSPLQEQMARLEAAEQERQVAVQQQQFAQRVTAIDAAGSQWREQRGVDEQTWDSLVAKAPQFTPMLDALAQQSGGDYGQATQRLLDHIYWTDESLREAEMQRRLEAERAALQEDYVRQTRAAAVSTAGSELAAAPAAKDGDMDFLNEIASRMSDGVPGAV